MLRLLIYLVVLYFPCLSVVSGGEDTDPKPETSAESKELSPQQTQSFLAQVRKNLGSIKTLKADFVQSRQMQAFKDTLTANGVFYFHTPGRIRWELTDPYRSILVYKKGSVEKYVYRKDRLTKLDSGSREVVARVMKFITSWMQGDFESSGDLFDMRVERDAGYQIHLTPRPTQLSEMIKRITLFVEVGMQRIDRVVIQEARGDEIAIAFSNQRRDLELDESLFAPK